MRNEVFDRSPGMQPGASSDNGLDWPNNAFWNTLIHCMRYLEITGMNNTIAQSNNQNISDFRLILLYLLSIHPHSPPSSILLLLISFPYSASSPPLPIPSSATPSPPHSSFSFYLFLLRQLLLLLLEVLVEVVVILLWSLMIHSSLIIYSSFLLKRYSA